MSNENLSTFSAPSAGEVRPRETTNSGELVSKRGKKIAIGGKIQYPYSTDAVMAGTRGKDEPKHARLISNSPARPMSGREARISEIPKKDSFGPTWQNGSVG